MLNYVKITEVMIMNFKKIAAVALTATMAFGAFAACSSDDGDDSVVVINSQAGAQQTVNTEHIAQVDDAGYYFEYNGVKIRVNVNAADTIAALGDDYFYFEADSCAGIGKSKTYTYGNNAFVISTVPVDDFDLITNVTLFDDSVATPEGICIGSSYDDVIAAYQQPTSEIDGLLTYELNDTMLVIATSDGVVESISYNQISLDAQQ